MSVRSKRSKQQLLLYKTDFFREKKELRESYENSRPIDETYGKNCWIMGLRRPKDFKGTRFACVNVGTNLNPIWKTVKETIPRETEKIRVVGKDGQKETDLFRKSDYFQSKFKNTSYDCFPPLEVKSF